MYLKTVCFKKILDCTMYLRTFIFFHLFFNFSRSIEIKFVSIFLFGFYLVNPLLHLKYSRFTNFYVSFVLFKIFWKRSPKNKCFYAFWICHIAVDGRKRLDQCFWCFVSSLPFYRFYVYWNRRINAERKKEKKISVWWIILVYRMG